MLDQVRTEAPADSGRHAGPDPRSRAARSVARMTWPSFNADRPDGVRHRRGASPRWSPRRSARRGERMPIGPLGVDRARRRGAVASALLWNRNATSFGVVVADNFGLFVTGVLIVVGLLSLAISAPTHRARAAAARRVLRADAVRHRRHDADGDGHRSAGDLPGARGAVARRLRADRASAAIRPAATEAAFKYFLLGAFSSAFFLYGIAFTYGVTGSTRLDRHRQR